MKLIRRIASSEQGCGGGVNCPAVHLTDRGTVGVQGWTITDPAVLGAVILPAGESIVDVPVGLLLEAVGQLAPEVPVDH